MKITKEKRLEYGKKYRKDNRTKINKYVYRKKNKQTLFIVYLTL